MSDTCQNLNRHIANLEKENARLKALLQNPDEATQRWVVALMKGIAQELKPHSPEMAEFFAIRAKVIPIVIWKDVVSGKVK